MTKKQYRLNKWGTRLLKDNRPLFDWFNDSDEIVDLLNAFCDEIEQLKQKVDFYKYFQRDARELEKAYIQLKHRHSLLHDECIDAECARDSLKKDVKSLEKENEQLKSILKEMVRVSEYNGAITAMRVKSMTYNFIGDFE